MKKLIACIIYVFTTLILPTNAVFADMSYNNENDFLTAVNNNLSFESFESLTATNTWRSTNNINVSDFSISTGAQNNLSIYNTMHGSGLYATDGSQYIGWAVRTAYPVAFNFNNSIFAFGVTLTDALDQFPNGSISLSTNGGSTFNDIYTGFYPGTTENFIGIITDTPFTEVLINGNYDEGIGIDSVYYTAVPEPGSLLLLGSGLVGVMGVKRKLKR